jgi:small-conductance mechanosensitive channel
LVEDPGQTPNREPEVMESLETYLQSILSIFGGNNYLKAATLLVVSLVAAKIADWLINRVLAAWARKSRTDLDDRLLALLHRPIFVSVVLLGLWLAVQQLALPGYLESFLLRVFRTLAILIWMVFGFRASALLIELLGSLEGRVSLIEGRTLSLFEKTAKIVLMGAAVYFVFLSWGIDVGALLVTGGIAGIAIGFAAKDTLANLFSGMFILADTPYEVGDFIVLDSGERGRVSQIGLRSTRLLTRDDIEITIPNAVIANSKITNESGGPWPKERVRVPVGVAYGSDIDQVRQVLLEIAQAQPNIDGDPEPRVRFRAFGDSALNLELQGWIHEPVLRGRVIDALNTEIYKRFAAEGIEIPYPKRDVYLHQQASPGGGDAD